MSGEIPGSQERAKDLITQSMEMFDRAGDNVAGKGIPNPKTAPNLKN